MTLKNNTLDMLKIVIPLAIILILFSGAIGLGIITFEKVEEIDSEAVTATVIIDFGQGTPKTYEITSENNTVYSFLMEVASKEGFDVKTTYYASFDSLLVDSISDYTAGQDNKYWVFYVNDEFATNSADKQIVNNGDVIEWKFEESQF